jgi:hypothetical protein
VGINKEGVGRIGRDGNGLRREEEV